MKNVILIGMPSAGKSTIGVLLAKALVMPFVDTDLLLQEKYGASLCDMIDEIGEDAFLRREGELLSSLSYRGCMIATGGSAVYSHEGMQHLARDGVLLYLKLDLKEIERRIGNIHTRGVVMHKKGSLDAMYEERSKLYEAYAHVTVDCTGLDLERCVEACVRALEGLL